MQETPEHDDLSTNLSACSAHLDFIASIPSLLAEMSLPTYTPKLPSVETLESTPIAPLVASHPSFKVRQQAPKQHVPSLAISVPKSTKSKPKSKLPSKLPRSILALPADKRPPPDPERWLPKRERKGYVEILAQREKEKEKKRLKARKKLEATMTQGSASGPGQTGPVESKANTQATNAGSNKGKKKKKGGK